MGEGRQVVRSFGGVLGRTSLVLALLACGADPTRSTVPFVVEPSQGSIPRATVGLSVDPSPTFIIRDAEGRVLADVPVSVTITSGNGRLVGAPTRSGIGPTSIGEWTLDTLAGENTVTILAGSAPAVAITVKGSPGVPARIEVSGADQRGLAGERLSQPLVFRVVDRFGNPIAGVDVAVFIEEGGGQVSPRQVTTTSKPAGAGVLWTLGHEGGAQRIAAHARGLTTTVGAQVLSDFAPEVRIGGTPPSPAFAQALQKAANRMRAIVTGDLLDVPVYHFDLNRCGVSGPAITELVDDLIIYATVAPLDGIGNVIASAGPCVSRTQSRLPVIGVIRIDAADYAELEEKGQLEPVVMHELLHVLGIGSLWADRDLLVGLGTSDPRFEGRQAATQCIASGGSVACSDLRVPAENTGGGGTANVHWREATFDRELMTGFIESDQDMPLSRVTVGALEDVGYTVNLSGADAFVLPGTSAVSPRLSAQPLAPWETLAGNPVFEVTPDGWIRPFAGKGGGGLER